ncbi:ImmA/IrrE family metallo-endopeptidase [Aeromonas sp. DNP9]|uniref:ImmA/IrrE family metallo-endopeptidase n=1 Tax=Aeromonas sp. DNP9 TaxID=1535548 RepID=UPI0009F5EE73|nr:ImmA/IrrE family metallo-endopeptidase [Aeromonas sp. DNP9]
MSPVEKMAARLLDRHKLKPPFDLDALVSEYANVEYHHFPFSVDGITIGIGGDQKPQVLINSNAPETRRKFTLAHELGHIIIPWHTGTIVSHLGSIDSHFEYMEMESEANLFASELLVPKAWLHELTKEFTTFESLIKKVLMDTSVSRDAAFIKIFKVIHTPIICAWIDCNGNLIKEYRTSSAPSSASLQGKNIIKDRIFLTAASEEIFFLGDRRYKSWFFERVTIEEIDPRPWREIINEILNDTGKLQLLSSINAILPSRYAPNKEKSESELCSLVIQAYDGRGKYDDIVSHPLFPQYVIKRIRELMKKNKR